eukprot:357298-Chlamydomonas_euryale.AAC.7
MQHADALIAWCKRCNACVHAHAVKRARSGQREGEGQHFHYGAGQAHSGEIQGMHKSSVHGQRTIEMTMQVASAEQVCCTRSAVRHVDGPSDMQHGHGRNDARKITDASTAAAAAAVLRLQRLRLGHAGTAANVTRAACAELGKHRLSHAGQFYEDRSGA